MASTAIRWVLPKNAKTGAGASVHLACHVKPGASSKREGISAVTPTSIDLCVAAQAKDGEANKAVRELIASVCRLTTAQENTYVLDGMLIRIQVLHVPKSDVEIARGSKSREKTVVVHHMPGTLAQEACESDIRKKLLEAIVE